ncbi:FAD/NAD(P)-dependent oxidoreductase [Paracoccus onubensis]|uniref:BFD/(2Fe-2S)-binding domain-containing protein n=1 Tax=Paracoccus onubensis TaxID=1675788 RepID=A0A418T894_9RHOB|nr:NAD(P)/FAD-dependent oxidoreductase [Paracoccus onubensis]RJE89445.1 BFD/(2Fe-2S)-binding domain-containing protein [Paracoccus onubensis]
MIADPRSVAGKQLVIDETTRILVVGAGPAGVAAARAAQAGGAQVVLIDENPVPYETMAEHVPQIWGGRMGGAVRNRNAIQEQMLDARPDLMQLFEAGVDIRLGTACWGLFTNQANLGWMPGRVAGLLDIEKNSHLIGFEQAIIATGRRDMGLAFPGWDQPGVMGANAALTLSRLYGALDSKRAVMLGATSEALIAALDLIADGIEIVAVVEQAAASVADEQLVRRIHDAGIEIMLNEAPRGVTSDANGVTGLVLQDRTISCDTVILGVGAVPMIDLLQAAGADCRFDGMRSGYVPALGAGFETSLKAIRAVGDCAGIWAKKSADASLAEAEGRLAAAAALDAIGLAAAAPDIAVPRPERSGDPAGDDLGDYRKAWVHASVIGAPSGTHVCQCEEITAAELLDVSPPHYLDVPRLPNRQRSLAEILGDGPPDPDHIKRLTRAGMGPCQGRRCREQIQALLALHEDLPLAAVPLAGYRSPVRPMTLVAASLPEDPAIAAVWDSWFGMPRQWVPYWEVDEKYTVASLATEKDHVSE